MDFYHLLNRGVDKRKIFLDKSDYFRFVHDLFEFNNVANVDPNTGRDYKQLMDVGRPSIERRSRKLLVKIHCFCLMPNHYHLLVSPVVENGVSLFMKKLNGGYAKYFNEKYDRSGALFQGKYKSVPIVSDAHFLYIPYYIHFNPLDLHMPEWREGKIRNIKKALEYLMSYRWSSHIDYSGGSNFRSVTQRDFFLDFFGGEPKYIKEVEKQLKGFDESQVSDAALE
ncbi:MAG: transposase [Parcubacteria group bacterium]|nr:transposase [Parcubacteria group bacterium]